LKITDVAGMEDIETAVGSRELFALVSVLLPPMFEGLLGENLILKIQQTNSAVLGKGLSIGLMISRLVL